ncbi:MAG: response regulator transcription factor [Actinobacteria bacterium]|nr:response regulator transcription factor [Actinomycetota bacterium]
MKIVVVEDEPRIASFLSKGLKAEGYAVHHAMNGRDGLSLVMNGGVDLMVLDLGLPDMDGSEVLRKLRQVGEQLPVIILTARGEIADRVEGLELGADDYMTKPFAFDELLARIRARLRPRGDHGAVLRVGDLKLDTRTRRAIAAGQEVDLSAREFALLETFMRHPGQVLSRAQLLSRVWGFDFDPGTNLVDVYVGYLRRKLGSGLLETVRGSGYRLLAPAES